MAKYTLRYFFDPGAAICLWTADDAARAKYGYAVSGRDLPLSENTWRRMIYLCAWYDTSIDWSYPPDPSPWDSPEQARFNAAAQDLLQRLLRELGPDYEILDESNTAGRQP